MSPKTAAAVVGALVATAAIGVHLAAKPVCVRRLESTPLEQCRRMVPADPPRRPDAGLADNPSPLIFDAALAVGDGCTKVECSR